MDADRFDTLTRSLTTVGSRRRALALTLGGALAPLLGRGESDAHNLLRKCKKKSGKQKKKCVKKAKKHNATHTAVPGDQVLACTPNCGGKACGDDGCDGSCGPCTNGTCTAGICTCSSPLVLCQGACVSACSDARTVLDPDECTCCLRNADCVADDDCCSGVCREQESDDASCLGRGEGEPCRFPEQCAYEICTDGVCRCPSGQPPCGNGRCADVCGPGTARAGGACHCCTTNGTRCAGNGGACCAGPNQCSVGGGVCAGLANGQECDFDAQCASGECQLSGSCGEGGFEQ